MRIVQIIHHLKSRSKGTRNAAELLESRKTLVSKNRRELQKTQKNERLRVDIHSIGRISVLVVRHDGVFRVDDLAVG